MADITLDPTDYSALENGTICVDGTTIEVMGPVEKFKNTIDNVRKATDHNDLISDINIVGVGGVGEERIMVTVKDGKRLYPELIEALKGNGFEPVAVGGSGTIEFTIEE
jgi:hypothetical protein